MDQAISQDKLKSKSRKRLAWIALAILGISFSAWAVNRAVSESFPMSSLRLSQVHMGTVDNTINASGTVMPVHEEQIPSPSPTRIAKILAKAGQVLKAGEVLMILDDRAIRVAIDNLREQISQQEIRVETLRLEMESNLRKIASEIELLELDLQSNQVKLARFKKLGAIGITSQVDLQAAELSVKRNEVQLRQHQESLLDTRKTTQSNIENARLQKSIFQKQYELQMSLLEQTQVKAPFDGLITWMMSDEGASVNAGQMIAKVSELNNFRVEASVSDFYARYLAPEQKVRVEYSGQILTGRVQNILPEIQNGTVKLLVSLDQPNHPLLRHKLRVETNIVTEHKNDALVLDTGPAISGKGRQEVYVLDSGRAVKRSIEVGLGDSKTVEITSGLKLGEQVIVSDVSRLKHMQSFRVTQ